MIKQPCGSNSLSPELIVGMYYKALYGGDLQSVKDLMTDRSYMMLLESFGLRLSLRDASFRDRLHSIGEDPGALLEVEEKLSSDLVSRNRSPHISIDKVEPNGSERITVSYLEDNQPKKLYFSKEMDGWQINYYAGRPIT